MDSLIIKGTKVYCFDPALKKMALMGSKIGETFFKQVKPIHFMRVVNGYGLQYDAFTQFKAKGINKIQILDENGTNWQSFSKDWLKFGKIADYGRGKQVFLSMRFMHRKDRAKEEEKNRQKEILRADLNIEKQMSLLA